MYWSATKVFTAASWEGLHLITQTFASGSYTPTHCSILAPQFSLSRWTFMILAIFGLINSAAANSIVISALCEHLQRMDT